MLQSGQTIQLDGIAACLCELIHGGYSGKLVTPLNLHSDGTPEAVASLLPSESLPCKQLARRRACILIHNIGIVKKMGPKAHKVGLVQIEYLCGSEHTERIAIGKANIHARVGSGAFLMVRIVASHPIRSERRQWRSCFCDFFFAPIGHKSIHISDFRKRSSLSKSAICRTMNGIWGNPCWAVARRCVAGQQRKCPGKRKVHRHICRCNVERQSRGRCEARHRHTSSPAVRYSTYDTTRRTT